MRPIDKRRGMGATTRSVTRTLQAFEKTAAGSVPIGRTGPPEH